MRNEVKTAVTIHTAYRVNVKGRGEMIIVAKNIAEACDKIENITDESYSFIHTRSFECAI